MHSLNTSKNIIPVSEFKSRASEWLRCVAENNEAVVITQRGKAAGVLLSPAAYDELTLRIRLVHAVEQGLADVESGRVTVHDDVVKEMRRRFAKETNEKE